MGKEIVKGKNGLPSYSERWKKPNLPMTTLAKRTGKLRRRVQQLTQTMEGSK